MGGSRFGSCKMVGRTRAVQVLELWSEGGDKRVKSEPTAIDVGVGSERNDRFSVSEKFLYPRGVRGRTNSEWKDEEGRKG